MTPTSLEVKNLEVGLIRPVPITGFVWYGTPSPSHPKQLWRSISFIDLVCESSVLKGSVLYNRPERVLTSPLNHKSATSWNPLKKQIKQFIGMYHINMNDSLGHPTPTTPTTPKSTATLKTLDFVFGYWWSHGC
jgi:hypothetical protein